MKKKRIPALLLLLLFVLALSACSASGGVKNEETGASVAASAPASGRTDGGLYDTQMLDEQVEASSASADSPIYSDPDAKVIRSAEIVIQALDFDRSVASLAELTESCGGYYETAQVNSGGYYDRSASRSAYYVVRVPKEEFAAFRDATGEVGHITSITEDSQDVGEVYYDTEARLATLTTKRERLLALLEKADIMEDIISLENALADVQYEIDQHTSTLRRYDSLIDYSSFTVHLEEVVRIDQEPGPQEGFGARLLSNVQQGLSRFVGHLEEGAFWLARNLIPLAVVVVAAVVVVLLLCRRRKKRRARRGDSGGTD